MVSDAKKKKAAAKKAKATAKLHNLDISDVKEAMGDANGTNGAAENGTEGSSAAALSERTCAGVLSSHPLARDVHVDSFTLLFHGHDLLQDARLEVNYGRRYGLLGANGCGKSTLLKALAAREVPIPEHIDIYHLDGEIVGTDKTALAAVMEVQQEKARLEKEAEKLMEMEMDDNVEQRLSDIYERLDLLGAETVQARAASILHGLGFTKEMQQKRTADFSGGWRMRIALARALFMKPTMLLLDEPTNHLDLEACVWLEEYLKRFDRILIMISHSQDFMNGVCTNIIHMTKKKLFYYSGNYDAYVKTRGEKEEQQMKQFRWEQDQIKHMKDYIARFGHGSAKLARQAQSKEKTLQKMVEKGLTERVTTDAVVKLHFENVGTLPPPVLQFTEVQFGYSKDKILYEHVDLGVDLDSRVAIVGPNGTGKSTLLKLMVGTLEPLDGAVKRHNHLRIGMYHQHLTELLPTDLSPLEYMMREFPGNSVERTRAMVGRFGITGEMQTLQLGHLSDGLKSRVVFSWLAHKRPHMLLLDEPTNHLDIETIDALANALNNWDGGMVLVSHDFRLIGQVAHEIWEVRDKGVFKWNKDIQAYKAKLKALHEAIVEDAS